MTRSAEDRPPCEYVGQPKSNNCGASLKEEAAERRRCEIDRKIASHPNAWSHGRMVPVSSEPSPPPENQSPQEPSDNEGEDGGTTRTSCAPAAYPTPEYIYRKYTRRAVPIPQPPSSSSSHQPDPKRPTDPREFHKRVSSDSYEAPTRPSQQDKLKKPGNCQQPRLRPCRSYSDEEIRPRTRPAQRSSSEEPPRRVRFARGTKDGDSFQPIHTRSKDRAEAAREDDVEEHRDKEEMDERKRTVRHKVRKGAGAFEIDGHDSEDAGPHDKPGRPVFHSIAERRSFMFPSPRIIELSSEFEEDKPTIYGYACAQEDTRLMNYQVEHKCSRRGICCGVRKNSFEEFKRKHYADMGKSGTPSSPQAQIEARLSLPDLKKAINEKLRFPVSPEEAPQTFRRYSSEPPDYFQPRTRDGHRSARPSFSKRRSSFTTPTLEMFREDPVSPSHFPHAPQRTEASIFTNSHANSALTDSPSPKRKSSTTSQLRRALTTRPVPPRRITEPGYKRAPTRQMQRSGTKSFEERLWRGSQSRDDVKALHRTTEDSQDIRSAKDYKTSIPQYHHRHRAQSEKLSFSQARQALESAAGDWYGPEFIEHLNASFSDLSLPWHHQALEPSTLPEQTKVKCGVKESRPSRRPSLMKSQPNLRCTTPTMR